MGDLVHLIVIVQDPPMASYSSKEFLFVYLDYSLFDVVVGDGKGDEGPMIAHLTFHKVDYCTYCGNFI